jgi:hypothetical protein
MKKLLHRIKPPCPKCPYTLGQVVFVRNPCPECKADNYSTYDELIKRKDKDYSGNKKGMN